MQSGHRATFRTAEEAFFASDGDGGHYTSEDDLVDSGFLSEESELHDIEMPSHDGGDYDVVVDDKRCGVVGHYVGQTKTDL